jgi:hypothetical protein
MYWGLTLPLLGASLILAPPNVAGQLGSMRVSVPSPTAASLGKFGDIPVSFYSGVPNISVPLFTAKGRTLELPIALSYHASGIRVEEIGGWVGIGWSLDAGGVITRTVRGTVDERGTGYFNTGYRLYEAPDLQQPPITLLDDIKSGAVDGEPDQFFFNFAGRSGEIVIGPTNSAGEKKYRTVPFQKWMVEPTIGADGISSWKIITEDGTQFTFAEQERHTDYSQPGSGGVYGVPYSSSWHLTEIKAPGGDRITLAYEPYQAEHDMGMYREVFENFSGNCSAPPDSYTRYHIAAKRLSSITTAAHTITFHTTLRSDALARPGAMHLVPNSPQEPRLDRIVVATPGGTVLRQFQFEHNYSTGRLTLTAVSERDSQGNSLPPHTFTYDSQVLPARTSFALDHWGYYNGKTANSTPIPAAIAPDGRQLSGADRKPDAVAMQAGVLKTITWPTGGSSEFTFEPNDYGLIADGTPLNQEVTRSSTIVTNHTGLVTKAFSVGSTMIAGTATATVSMPPYNGDCTPGDPLDPCPWVSIVGVGTWYAVGSHTVFLNAGQTYEMRASEEGHPVTISLTVAWKETETVQSKMASGLRISQIRTLDAMGNEMVRKYVYTLTDGRSSGVIGSEPRYDYSFEGNRTGFPTTSCRFYSRSSMSKMPLGGGPLVTYRDVTVWHGAGAEHGKTRHTFEAGGDPAPAGTWPYLRRTSNEWKRGQELSSGQYAAAGQIQQRVVSTYDLPTPTETTTRFRGLSLSVYSDGAGPGLYIFNPFEVVSGWKYQNGETLTQYDTLGTSSFSSTRSFVYGNPKHVQLTEIVETNSDGTQRVTRMKYPGDYAAASSGVEGVALNAMQGASNIQNAVIERWVSKRVAGVESVMEAELTTFKEYAPGQILPYQRFVFNNPRPLP